MLHGFEVLTWFLQALRASAFGDVEELAVRFLKDSGSSRFRV